MSIEIIREPEFVGPDLFKSVCAGEVFEHEGHYYKKLPYELSTKYENQFEDEVKRPKKKPSKKEQNKKMGLAIALDSDFVIYMHEDEPVLCCDIKCAISYIYARQKSVLEK
jgi:hypothetical protein